MAVSIAVASTGFTTATTWATVDSTSFLDSEVGSTLLTTSFVESQTFTPGAITIDGIAVKVATRAASPSGTISVRLSQAGVAVAGTTVTINVSDIASRNGEQGWYFFKFSAPVTLLAATLYTVGATTSVSSQVNLYRNATGANWSRMLRTTTTGALSAGDSAHILGEWTAAATVTARTVTMDQTAATDYGDNSKSNPPGFTIGSNGTLTWGTTASTAYQLKLSTNMMIYVGGTMNMGTTGTPVPRNSSHLLLFDCDVADGDFGLTVYGTWNCQGQSRTSAKNVVQCLLNADAAGAATSLTVDTDTGWLNTDDIAIGSTTRTATQAEQKTLNADAGATTLSLSAGLANAHSGTSPTQAELILLTYNVRVESNSSTFMAYVLTGGASVVDIDWTRFRYLGSTTTGKRGLEVNTTSSGSFAMAFSCLRDFDSHGLYVTGASFDNVTITDVVGYKVGGQTSAHYGINFATASTGTNWSVTRCTIISNNTGGGGCFNFSDIGGAVSTIRASSTAGSSSNGAIQIDDPTGRTNQTWTGLNAHSTHSGPGIYINAVDALRIDNITSWRNGSNGSGIVVGSYAEIVLRGTNALFGNTSANILWATGALLTGSFLMSGLTASGDTTFSTAAGLVFPSANSRSFPRVTFENSTFGVVSGIKTAHTTADIDFNSSSIAGNTQRFIDLYLNHVNLASATEITNDTGLFGRSAIHYQRVDQATNIHKTRYPSLGTVARETTTVHTSPVSSKLTPSGATAGLRLQSGPARVPVASGATKTPSVWVRKDGSYTGSAPRLILKANPALGITDDVVLATFSAAADTWQQLSGTSAAASEAGVLEMVVDCDGSAGNVYVADWAAA